MLLNVWTQKARVSYLTFHKLCHNETRWLLEPTRSLSLSPIHKITPLRHYPSGAISELGFFFFFFFVSCYSSNRQFTIQSA